MTTIHTAHGPGSIVDQNTVRGRTQYKVAGDGFSVWLDEVEINKRTAADENLFSYAYEPGMTGEQEKIPGIPNHTPSKPGHGMYGHRMASDPHDRAGDAWAEGRDRGDRFHQHQDLGDYDEDPGSPWGPDNRAEETGWDWPEHTSPGHTLYTSESPGYNEDLSYHPPSPHGEGRYDMAIDAMDRLGAGWHPPEKAPHDPEFDDYEDYGHHAPDSDFDPELHGHGSLSGHVPTANETAAWEQHQRVMGPHHASSSFDFEPTDHVWDNHTTLPYKWQPQFPVDMFRAEQTISPDHQIDLKERMHDSDSRTGEDREPTHTYPGPNPDLFAKSAAGRLAWTFHDEEDGGHQSEDERWDQYNQHAQHGLEHASSRPSGLSDKYADIHDAADHYNDPVVRFRDDPMGAIQRHGYIDISAGLDHETGEWMNLVEADKSIRTAAWNDVRDKAMRLKREGRVHVKDMSLDHIYANVEGDNGDYEVMILKGSAYGGFKGKPTGQSIANWKCSCKWGQWAFKRQLTYVGRLCSHGYASYLTMQGEHAKNPKHPFRKRHAGVDDFKKWVKDENGDHFDTDAADSYLSTLEKPVTKEDAQAVYDYVETHHTERPERDYNVKGYHYDDDPDVLQHQPGKLSPHLYVVPEGEEQHFEDLGDDRKTIGPDQIMARRRRAKGADAISEHHPDFAWHTKGEPDMPEQGIVHFSMRRHALTFTADEDLLNDLRDLSQEQPSEHYQDCQDHNREVSEKVQELHDRGYDAAPLVAMKRAALWKVAVPIPDDPDQREDVGHQSLGDPPTPQPLGQDPGNVNAGKPGMGTFGEALQTGLATGKTPSAIAGEAPGLGKFTDELQQGLATGHAPNGPQTPAPNPGLASAVSAAPGPGGGSPISPENAQSRNQNSVNTTGPGPVGGNPNQWGAGPGQMGSGFQGPGGTGDWLKSNESTAIGAGEHTVKPGETVSDIQNRAGGGAVSGISGDLIRPGDKYTVGPGGGAGGAAGGAGPKTVGPAATQPTNPSLAGEQAGANALNKAVGLGGSTLTGPGTKTMGPPAAQSGANALNKAVGLGGSTLIGPGGMPNGAPVGGLKNSARRFAERYFYGADDTGDNDPNKKNVTPGGGAAPVNTAPVGQGVNYKQLTTPGQPVDAPRPASGGAAGPTDVHSENLKATPGSGGGTTAPNALPAPGGGQNPGQQGPGQKKDQDQGAGGGGMGGGGAGAAMNAIAPLIGEIPGMLSGIGGGGGIGGLAGGLGGILHGLGGFHLGAQDFAAQYMLGADSPGGMGAPSAAKPAAKPAQANPAAGQPTGQTGAPAATTAASAIVGQIPNLLSGGGGGFGLGSPGVGGLTKGMGGITKTMSAQHYARQYMAGGDFLTKGGPDWMDFPFSGVGPDRQDWSGTAENYIDEHERPNRQETWRTDNDGDIIKYTTQPKQARRVRPHAEQYAQRYFQANGDMAGSGDAGYGSLPGGTSGGATLSPSASGMGNGGSFSHADSQGSPGATMGTLTNTASMSESSRHFWADAFSPGDTGYFNHHNRPYQEDDSAEKIPGMPHGKGKAPGVPGAPAGGSANEAAGVGEAAGGAGELAELAPLLASRHDDDSDVVRQFHASGAGALGAPSRGGQFDDDAIAANARKMLRTAGRHFTPAEERELEDEHHVLGARNLRDLDLSGTHYEDE